MKSSRNLIATLALIAVSLRADLPTHIQHLASETQLREIFFRDGRRPPRETIAALTARISTEPKQAQLYRLRAAESELALDFTAAEADWKTYAQLTGDHIALADFYHRRLRPTEEIQALDRAATPAAFERAIAVAEAQAYPDTVVITQYRVWIAVQPRDAALHKRFIHYLTDHGQVTAAERQLQVYRAAFPKDESTVAAVDKNFRPLMPAEWLKGYFDLLSGRGKLRDFLAQARSAAVAEPESLDPVARMLHYYQYQSNTAAARRVLIEYRARKKNWTADELYFTAKLFETVGEWDQAARQYYALYSLPAGDAAAREHGLAGLAGVLLTAPEQPVRFGSGDLSLYKDAATMDRHPGFLNGILSLVLNTESPRWEYDRQNARSAAWFHRARASELLDLLDAKFPRCPHSPALHGRLIESYLNYGDNEGVVRAGRRFLTAYRHAPERSAVTLWMADAFAREGRTGDEFALYDQLLAEHTAAYASVLDRYVARLVGLERLQDALALYRREIDRNPNDPALFEKLAAFLDQNHLAGEIEQVYKRAAERFPDRGWQNRLARWYLSLGRARDYAELTRQVVKIFSGTELERYFHEAVAPASLDPVLYRQLNLYAHERFPDDLAFVRNLLAVYQRKETRDPAAYARLLGSYWFYDDQLRARLFEDLSRQGKLDTELAATRHADASVNPAAAQFFAEGEAWRSHFETAAPVMRELAAQFPGSRDLVLRATSVERSLGNTEAAVTLARNLTQIDPRDRESLARVGDIYADRELLVRAQPYWDRMARIEPGKSEGYLEAATVFWDYYKYDDALRLIHDARAKLKNPALYAYEAGAIYEGKRDYAGAIREYMKGAVENCDVAQASGLQSRHLCRLAGQGPAEARLLALAQRPARRATIDQVTAAGPVHLRAAVLESQQRWKDLETLLRTAATRDTSSADLTWVEQNAGRLRFPAVEQLAVERQIALTRDPVDYLRLRLALVRLHERHNQTAAAEHAMEEIAKENPAILGVVRAATDFYWRNNMPDKAIDTLARAATAANPEYRKQFTLEAARKATEAREFAKARQFLAPLLAAEPFDAQYLAAMAATYAQSGDDSGLRDFYRAKIEALRQAHLPADELRRGLIPALVRLGDGTGAVDQYVELINRYPEDQGLIREATTYATGNALQPRLIAYYTKAASDSPKDFRWPMVLARLETHAENFDAAIAAYTHAIGVRPDRTDLYLARGTLEERLMRFAAAEKTYRRVWELSYRDPQWLEKVAELAARQGKTDAAIAALREANPNKLMEVARKLDSWGLVEQALGFARRAAAGKVDDQDRATYAGILIRARKYEDALAQAAQAGNLVDLYYTPEEKAAFAKALEKHAGTPAWIQMAGQAGLHDLEARWLAERLSDMPDYERYRLVELQHSRLRFQELGKQLESTMPAEARRAYYAIGDLDGLARLFAKDGNDPRYMALLARRDPARLVQFSARRNDAADAAVASGSPKLALDAIAARSHYQSPLWANAYTGLTGLYYWRDAPDVSGSFRGALGPMAIGDRLGKPVDRARQLVGDQWFYYGARFGEYLSLRGGLEADDYLPAFVEGRPGDAGAYAERADWFEDRGDARRAMAEYRHSLELDADQGAIQDRIARLLWKQGKRDEAFAHWKSALGAFEAQQGRPNLAESFWTEAPAAIEHIGECGLAPRMRKEIGSLLSRYEKRHESYRVDPLLRAAAKYGVLDLAAQPEYLLGELSNADWLSVHDRIGMLRRLIELHDEQSLEWRLRIVKLLLEPGDVKAARAELEPIRGKSSEAEVLELRIAAKMGKLDSLLATALTDDALRGAAFALRNEDNAAASRVLEFLYSRSLDRGNFESVNFLGLAEIRLERSNVADAVQLLRRMQLISGDPFENLLPAADLLERYKHNAEAREFLQARVNAVPWDYAARVRLGDGLDAIVKNPNVPYRVRVDAARRGAKGGGGELALVARGNITAAEAGQPYYYDARIVAAAGARDATVRLRLLLDAVAIRPRDSTPLVPLLRAALDAHQYDLAVTVSERAGAPDDLVHDLVAACVEIGDDRRAAQLLQQRINGGWEAKAPATLGQTSAIRERWQRELAPIERRITLATQNTHRRPSVSDSLQQSGVVRPRIEP